MTSDRSVEYLTSLFRELVQLPTEAEWVEFKRGNDEPKAIGEYISALSNSAALLGKPSAYVLWGVDADTHEIVGTSFTPRTEGLGTKIRAVVGSAAARRATRYLITAIKTTCSPPQGKV